MKLRLTVFFLLWFGVCALGMGTNGVPPFFGSSSGISAIPSIFDQVASPGSQAVCWSFRACATAVAGNKIANICNAGDAACVDMSSSGNGNLVVTTVGGTNCAVSTCTVKTLYEQETCGSTCNQTQATIANRPIFVPNCTPNGHACMTCLATSTQYLQSVGNIPNIAQAFSQAVFAKGNNPTGAGAITAGANSGSFGSEEFINSTNQYGLNSGSAGLATAANNVFHSVQAVHNGATSSITVDGTTTSGLSVGTANFSGTNASMLCNSAFTATLTGAISEVGVFGSFVMLSGTQITNLYNNQHAYW